MLSISLNDSFTEINNKLRNAIAEVDPSIISINRAIEVDGVNNKDDKDKQVTEVEVTAEDTTKLFDEVVSTNSKPTTRNPFLTALKVGKTHIDVNDKFLKFGFHQILPKLYFHTTDETVLVINYGMGTGKTILMATCIFYEFLVASKFPKDERFIHNALVFAPDKTVLQSLKEIKLSDCLFSIGSKAFYNTTALTSIIFTTNVEKGFEDSNTIGDCFQSLYSPFG